MAGWVEDTQGLIKIPTPGGAGGYGAAGKGAINLGGYMNAHAEGPGEISGLAIGLGETARAAGQWAEVFREQEERQQRIDAQSMMTESQDRWRVFYEDMMKREGREAFDSPERALEFAKGERETLLAGAKGGYQREMLESYWHHSRAGWLDSAVKHRMEQQNVYERQTFDGGMKSSLRNIDAAPESWEGHVAGQIALMSEMNPGAAPDWLAAREDEIRSAAAKQAVSAFLARGDFAAAEGVIEKAGVSSELTLALRREVEGQRSARKTEARSLLSQDLDSHLTGIALNGQGLVYGDGKNFGSRAAEVLEPGALGLVKKQEAAALDVYGALNDPAAAYSPLGERIRELEDKYVRPITDHAASGRPAYPGLEDDLKIAGQIQKAIEEKRKAFREDPIGAVDPAAQQLLKTQYGADPKAVISRRHEIETRHDLLARQDPTLRRENLPVLTKAEGEALREEWEKADDRGKAALFKKWDEDYGGYLPRALAEAKVPPAGYLFALLSPHDPVLARTLLIADGKKPEDYKGLDKIGHEKAEEAIAAAYDKAGVLAVQKGLYEARADDAAAAEQHKATRELLGKAASELVERGKAKDVKAAVQIIAGALDAGYTSVDDRDLGYVSIPKDLDAGAVMRGMNAMKLTAGGWWDQNGAFFRNAGEDGVAVDLPGGQTMKMTFEDLAAVGAGENLTNPPEGRLAQEFPRGGENPWRGDVGPQKAERAAKLWGSLGRREEKSQWAETELWAERTVERLKKEKEESRGAAGATASGNKSGEAAAAPYYRWLPETHRERLEPYAGFVQSAAEEYGVPAEIIAAVMMTESKGRAGAVSPTGVRGLMQVTQATYTGLGFTGDRSDPQNSIRAGAKALADNFKAYGNWADALRAYNGGGAGVTGARGGSWGQWAGNPAKQREILNYAPTVFRYLKDFTGAGV